jgi:6-pyruvoyltetrahydropterin/6-carboxytetrahydropterin synthase
MPRTSSGSPEFHVRVAGDDLAFSAGHFITLPGGACERLHGHSYRVAAEIFGPLGEQQCVVDFSAVRSALKAVVAELDHRVLLPAQHPAMQVCSRSGEVEVRFADRRWVFPEGDCLLLPIANTTTESLAQYVGRRLLDALKSQCGASLGGVRIEIGEGTGCSAICEM